MRLSRNITMTDRPGLFAIACGLIAMLVSGPRIAAEPAHTPAVRLRVDDYAAVASGLLAQAQEVVTQLYGAIGVETTWLSTRVLSSRPIAAPLSADGRVPDLTVIVLDPGMTRRMARLRTPSAWRPRRNDRGRIAYVFYDRLRMVTLQREASDVAALSLVMAHEIGHLLLPYSSHSDEGVMRGHWDLEGFRHLDLRRLTFTRRQGQQIRRLLGGD